MTPREVLMNLCEHDPEGCGDCHVPPLLAVVAGEDGARLAALARRLLPRLAGLVRHWAEARTRAGLAPGAASGEGEAKELLEALGAADSDRVVAAALAAARRGVLAGVSLRHALESARLFGESCLHLLGAEGVPVEELYACRAALDRLGHARALLATCAHTGGPASPSSHAARRVAAPARASLCGMVGASPPMQLLYTRIEQAARDRDTVLVLGESGTGKELVARAIHALGGDPPDRFVAVNCAALPRDLMESELFGHRRGAFSGALESRPGLVRAASGGTLFLDEVTELYPEAQAKLLRVIQERVVRPVGEVRESPVELRIVAATNQPVGTLLAAGRLRRDLYYRLQRQLIEVPPLRDRLEDLPLLVQHLARRWARERRGPGRKLSGAALAQLSRYSWPGNVRELENALYAAFRSAEGPLVDPWQLPPLGAPLGAPEPPGATEPPLSLRDAERQAIERALRESGGNKSRASRVLGISRKQLYVKLRDYELQG